MVAQQNFLHDYVVLCGYLDGFLGFRAFGSFGLFLRRRDVVVVFGKLCNSLSKHNLVAKPFPVR